MEHGLIGGAQYMFFGFYLNEEGGGGKFIFVKQGEDFYCCYFW